MAANAGIAYATGQYLLREPIMVRLLVAMAIGLILAVGATAITAEVLTGVANGTPTNKALYNYGTR